MQYSSPVYSPDGKRIAFSKDSTEKVFLYQADPDGKNQVDLFSVALDFHGSSWLGIDPKWSPDAKTIAFNLYIIEEQRGLYILNPNNRAITQLASVKVIDSISWAPDGKSIAYISVVGGSESELHIISTDGRNDNKIALGQVNDLANVSWSPNGDYIAFHAARKDVGVDAIYLFDTRTGTIKPLTSDSSEPNDYQRPESNFSWIPDGTGIVYTGRFANYPVELAHNNLWTVNLTGRKTRLTDGPDDAGKNYLNPKWRPKPKVEQIATLTRRKLLSFA